ncbi:50S ribosomal protein P1 [Haloprofundus halobius]|uniref:50S ribosomal protein P1 n=1 Tax=Haloprofundus halobius TaxID=2876194 RepID=UPI001CCCAED7|nr:50S ribosomal protein P1 [Haloprofundus halobius]
MEYVYAALILNETDEEINEDNVTAVLEAAGVDVEESRVKALVAALEDVDIEDAIETAAAAPAAAPAGGSADSEELDTVDEDEAEEAEGEAEAEEDEEDEEASGEGLGNLFG